MVPRGDLGTQGFFFGGGLHFHILVLVLGKMGGIAASLLTGMMAQGGKGSQCGKAGISARSPDSSPQGLQGRQRGCSKWVDEVRQVGDGVEELSWWLLLSQCIWQQGQRPRVWWGRGWRSEERARYDVVT